MSKRTIHIYRWLLMILGAVLVGFSLPYELALASYFDDAPLKFSPFLSPSPMYTLVGITDWGRDILKVYGITTVIVCFVFLTVAVPTIYVLFRFRAKGDESVLPKQVTGNHKLEILWTVIPVILLVLIAIPTWQAIFKQDRAVKEVANRPAGEVLKVQAIGHQWWWEFIYTDFNVTTANELVLP